MAAYNDMMDRSKEAIHHLEKAIKVYGESSPKAEEIKRRMEIIRSS
jgi:hypothetical protein